MNAPPRSVLVVEDDPIIAFDLETILKDLRCDDVVVFRDNSAAMEWLSGRTPRLAILDFKLEAETSLETAAALARRAVPTAFVTGYGERVPLPAVFADWPVFDKPVARNDLEAWVQSLRPGGC